MAQDRQPAAVAAAPLEEWTPRSTRLGAYVHVPFCIRRCGYCSFNTAPHDAAGHRRYLGAIRREMELVSGASWGRSVQLSTVFFGGGTPSLLEAAELADILDRLRQGFGLEEQAEVTVECNPESVSRERLEGYRAAGANRISLGVQSLDDHLLGELDRLHSAPQARSAFDAARAAGFDNVSVDLIYGLPGLDLTLWERSLREVFAWKPDHLSAYALTLDEGSRWRASGVQGLPAEETVTEQYWRLTTLAARAGHEHYEVSNYARPGRRSAHNQIYWRAEEYVAFGPGACGFLGRARYANIRALGRYCEALEAGRLPVESQETLTDRQMVAERLILGLRLSDGVPVGWLDERLGLEAGRLPAVLDGWRERGLLIVRDGRARLTEAGFLLSDALFTELL